jgi:hypothetical protein
VSASAVSLRPRQMQSGVASARPRLRPVRPRDEAAFRLYGEFARLNFPPNRKSRPRWSGKRLVTTERLLAIMPINDQNPPGNSSEPREINWQNDPRIILNDQAAIAAYIDEYGNLVITQRDTLGDPESTLLIAPESVKAFARAISSLAGETNVTDLRIVRGTS